MDSPGCGFEHLGHEMDDGAVGVELGGGVAGVVGELLDQVFVALAKLVLWHIGDRQRQTSLKCSIRSRSVASGSRSLLVHCASPKMPYSLSRLAVLDGRIAVWIARPTFFAVCAHFVPVGFARNLEAVVLCEVCAIVLDRRRIPSARPAFPRRTRRRGACRRAAER